MTADRAPHHPLTAPNHHADHHGFSGLPGALLALGMSVGRGGDADLAIRLTRLREGDPVVDVGCGSGAAVRRAAGMGARVTGVDPAPVMLRVARAVTLGRRGGRATYVDGVAEALPVPDGSAEVVWALATVHHWPQVEEGVAEAHRVLRPGGRFLAAERRTRADATGLASHGWTDDQAEAFATLCREAGFADVRVEHHSAGKRDLVTVLGVRP